MAEQSAAIGEWKYLIIDCIDNHVVAQFWAQVLGSTIKEESPPYIDLYPVGGTPRMSFQEVNEVKQGKNRVHVDIKVADLEVARERVIKLGGSVVQKVIEPPYEWYVMADPEGNEFCLVEN